MFKSTRCCSTAMLRKIDPSSLARTGRTISLESGKRKAESVLVLTLRWLKVFKHRSKNAVVHRLLSLHWLRILQLIMAKGMVGTFGSAFARHLSIRGECYTMHKITLPASHARQKRSRTLQKLSFLCITIVMLLAIALGTATFMSGKRLGTAHAQQTVNPNCTLIVPAHPLTAHGLATPYQLVATDPAMGPCHETNTAQTAFVQGAVFDVTTNTISVYDPLVIDQGTKPAIPPVVPTLPKNAVVALWFGFNGAVLKLQGTDGSLQEGRCVNGLGDSLFGQFAYCNAPAFFAAANQAIRQQALTPPPLGIAKNGLECPSTRDFSVVDMDQSDNVTATYLALPNGQTAQNTAANRAKLKNFTVLVNPSDEKLLVGFIFPALGCTPWMVPNLADNGSPTTALPLN